MYVFEHRGGVVLHPETKQERDALALLLDGVHLERHPEYEADYAGSGSGALKKRVNRYFVRAASDHTTVDRVVGDLHNPHVIVGEQKGQNGVNDGLSARIAHE